jgi:formate dehydrogenase maturation protein FdhE
MKVLILVLLLVSTAAFGGDIFYLKRGVRFDHYAHQTENVGICAVCHEQPPGEIANFGKGWAHKNCIACHDLYNAGPTECTGCHNRA